MKDKARRIHAPSQSPDRALRANYDVNRDRSERPTDLGPGGPFDNCFYVAPKYTEVGQNPIVETLQFSNRGAHLCPGPELLDQNMPYSARSAPSRITAHLIARGRSDGSAAHTIHFTHCLHRTILC